MRAVLCKAFGAKPDDLVVEDVTPPILSDGEVRIDVHATGLNFADTLLLKGEYQVKPELPFSPGLEIAGEVIECAPGVDRCNPGDRVMAMVDYGGFAEEAVASADRVHVIPDNVDYVTAAGFPVAYGTSHLGLKYRARLADGETLLVNGAAGGVGLTAVEIGKRMGAEVIATAGGAEKLEVPRQYGADHLIDYRAEDIRARVRDITGGRGVDVVYDPVGGYAFEASLRSTALGGRILVIGFASGTVPQVPANILLVKNITLLGYYWGQYLKLNPALMAESFEELLTWLGAGELKPHVSHTFGLEDAAQALDALASRRSTGKVVLRIRT